MSLAETSFLWTPFLNSNCFLFYDIREFRKNHYVTGPFPYSLSLYISPVFLFLCVYFACLFSILFIRVLVPWRKGRDLVLGISWVCNTTCHVAVAQWSVTGRKGGDITARAWTGAGKGWQGEPCWSTGLEIPFQMNARREDTLWRKNKSRRAIGILSVVIITIGTLVICSHTPPSLRSPVHLELCFWCQFWMRSSSKPSCHWLSRGVDDVTGTVSITAWVHGHVWGRAANGPDWTRSPGRTHQ